MPLSRRLAVLLAAALLALAGAATAAPATAQQWDGPGSDDGGWDGDGDSGDDRGEDALDRTGEEEAGPPAEVLALERATGDLGRAKRAGAARATRLSRSSARTLRPCLRGGPGWKRIRSIAHAPQRSLYAASARRLLTDMRRLLDVQQPLIAVHGAAYGRFVDRLRAAGAADPALQAGVAAQARRLASYRDVARVKASCKVFNRVVRGVREFPTRSASQIVRADYRASPVARRIQTFVASRLARIDRRHGVGHRDADALARAARRMVELGGQQGYATGFQYALSLR